MSTDADGHSDAVHDALAQVVPGVPISWVVVATWMDEDGVEQTYLDGEEGQHLLTAIGLTDWAHNRYLYLAAETWNTDDQ